MQVKALPGFRDFYPEEFALRRHIADAWRAVAGRYGFEEYDGPPLEPLELYTAKSGDEIVDQLYRFTDKGGREVALRPEMTPTLARMVAARANGLKKPIRWFSMPQLFRYERQQRGRLREHFQLNCDLIGEPGPLGDAEIMALAIDVMRELGLTERDVRVRVSDRRMLTSRDGERLPRSRRRRRRPVCRRISLPGSERSRRSGASPISRPPIRWPRGRGTRSPSHSRSSSRWGWAGSLTST
jgi:histidyl-tRNA synthetase